ncbi:MAG: hypothetical protein JSV21_01130 [Nitrospirota bacterium]|nr:MAG: hypothetical protein JSV21_01130 [Nitrospirota bacterium]
MGIKEVFTLGVTRTGRACAVGEEFGREKRELGDIPVLSCEGGCIKGEIARRAANIVSKEAGFARACHGALFTTPQSDLAGWIRDAAKAVVIDGCPLACHGRIAENIIDKDRLITFDALSIHRKYAALMDVDDVPDEHINRAARQVADKVLEELRELVRLGNLREAAYTG